MIKQLHRSKTSDKQKKSTFIAFQNERDSLGRIIQRRVQKKNEFNIMELFENLRKSTKEYFFEKEFQKMSKKFELFKKNNLKDNKSYDYEKQVDKCIEIANKLIKNKSQDQKNKQNLYVNLRQSIDKKINRVTTCLKRLKSTGRNRPQMDILKQLQGRKQINIELFKSLSPKSEMMAKFCANGLKYSSMVEEKKFNPWKTWYKNQEFELFPGKKVEVKTRLKSIYE